MITASTSASRTSASGSSCTRAPPATAAARTGSASATAATSAPRTSVARRRTWAAPMPPQPMTPIRTRTAGSSDGGREVHVAAVMARVLRLLGPAARDRLAPRVEAHALRPVDVVVAEQRVLPAPERVERHRHRDPDVDADHPHLHLALEDARRLAAGGEDRGTVGVGV